MATDGFADSRDDDDNKIIERLSGYDHEKTHQRLSRKRLMGTTQWFLDHPYFKAWFTEKSSSSLWCSGRSKPASFSNIQFSMLTGKLLIVGSGKTMIASATLDSVSPDFSLTIQQNSSCGHCKILPS